MLLLLELSDASTVTNNNNNFKFNEDVDTTLRVFGVGRRIVGRSPGGGGGSRTSGALATRTAGSLSAAHYCPPEADRRRRAHKTLDNRDSVSPSAARSSARRTVSRILVTTSGELILLPVWGWHPKVNAGQRPLARYSDCDMPTSFSRTLPVYRTLRVHNGG